MNNQGREMEAAGGEEAAAEFLKSKSLFYVRQFGRALGIQGVALYKKAELISLILQKVSENKAAIMPQSGDSIMAADLQTLQKMLNIG